MNDQPGENEVEVVSSPIEEITSGEYLEPTAAPQETLREEAAREIAKIVICGFLFLFAIPFVYLFTYPTFGDLTVNIVPSVIDMIKTIAAVLSGIVGAVIGYYFRREG